MSALEEGYIPHKDDLFLIHGPGGVGKSSLISMFLGKERDLVRVSTAVAEECHHLCPVRDVSNKMFTDKWVPVDVDRQACMVAHTGHHLLTSEGVAKVVLDKETARECVKSGTLSVAPPSNQPFLATDPSILLDPTKRTSTATQTPQSSSVSPSPSLSPLPTQPKHSSQPARKSGFARFLEKVRHPRRHHQEATFANALKKGIFDKDKVPLRVAEDDEGTLVSSLEDDPDNISNHLDEYQATLNDLMWASRERNDLVLSYSIRVLDSGGQPQFHEVVSIILPAITGIVSVFKLSELLDAHGEVVFYNKAGKEDNDPYKSYLTNEQVIRHDLLAIQSEACQRGLEEIPSLAFVGTFLDKQHECPDETPDQKDERLRSMITTILPPDMRDCIISNGVFLKQVMFRLNTRKPSDKDYETAGRLKEALMKGSRVKPKNLPLKWCSYEVALRKLMKKIGRQTLSLKQCKFIGHRLGFDPVSLKACLHYLRKFHIISFYDVLPDVMFGSSQVILDKITELVAYSLQLKKGGRALNGIERKFHQQGILSLEILQSEACSEHYKEGLFSTEDLLKVLKSLLIITEVGDGQYLMPCVLEVSAIYPLPSVPKGKIRSSFVLHFSKESPMIGVYCCTISYLLTEAGWNLLTEDGEAVQIARNSITFELPQGFPGKLTFLDPMSSYLEVVVELPVIVAADSNPSLYREIRDTFIIAMKQAMKTLNYEVRTPELSFLCPEQSSECSPLPHLARVNASCSFLTCSIKPVEVFAEITQEQKKWLQPNSKGVSACT